MSDERRERYAAAMRHADQLIKPDSETECWGVLADAAMAVADAEQTALRAENEGLDEALRGVLSVSEKDSARLRAELERLRAELRVCKRPGT